MITISSPAKINLGLQILGKRSDGYHNINSVFVPISLSDTISLEKNASIIVECSPSLDIPQESNLAYKAATVLFSQKAITEGAKITIEKHIPNGAGLGGGSSNAAYTLLGLQQLYSLELDYQELSSMAETLGSDVPFFLCKNSALVSGRGENVESFKFPYNAWVLLVFANVHVPTSWAYSQISVHNEGVRPKSIRDIVLMSSTEPSLLKTYLENDFEKPIFNNFPILREIKEALYNESAFYAQMSGSGSSVYGLFHNQETALEASKRFREFRSWICTTL